ncbi:MAG: efflux RND transporter periplasmic adaptor subunit [Chitinophagales bacterium]|nr:efflux RND transporter periplasmic adaptor subunit [Chitinophagales bacterium]
MSKKILISLALVLFILLALVIWKKDALSDRNALEVFAQEASYRSIVESVNCNGKIYPFKEVQLSLELPGEVTHIYVSEGDSVSKGQLLLEINADSYESSVSQSEANYKQTLANLANAKARKIQSDTQLAIIEKDYNRKKALLNQQVISQSEFEATESQYFSAIGESEAASQTVEANKFQAESALAGLQQTKENLSKTKLYAPMNGIVSKLNVDLGEKVVGTAQMAGTELITISDFSALELKVEVGENEVLRINKGDTAIIEVDAYLGDKIKGIVSQVAYSSNVSLDQQVTKFEVVIQLVSSSYAHLLNDHVKLPFRPGMSASAEIITNKKDHVLCVPIQSVSLRDKDEEGAFDEKLQIVFKVEDNQAIQTEVKTGIQDDSYIEIVEGVQENELIISAPFKAISKLLQNEDLVKLVSEEDLYDEN